MSGAAPHVPVLLDEVIEALAIAPSERHVDATFGAGGYSRAMMAKGATVIAFDRDPDAIAEGRAVVEASEGRLILVEAPFSALDRELEARELAPVDGVTMDIGVSSMQLDRADRGFSFQADGPLDMRMSQDGPTAADFVNTADESEIADVLYLYGEERQSRRIARAIVAARPLETTGQLARLVRKATGHKPHDKKDPATRTFQAIRIHVNGELEQLRGALAAARAAVAGFTADVETTDMDAAIAEATRILSAHLEEVKAAGGAVAPARSIAQLRADPECADDLAKASAIVFLPVLTALGRTVRVNLSLDEATLALIDREAKDRGITRSAMVQAAARAMAESRVG